ncbi:MAG: A/G-specific adenine glycosylase [Flavobacteriaceae bacterium]|nr:A/G-specific adenine glycosylase [Flavobacteriaceae bacterium]
MLENTTFFTKNLITWYLQNKRELPWRRTKDPYKVWLSEIILQQTRVAQGLPYYEKFISAFPEVRDLAEASEEEVLKLWQGLGYYSRARNLHFTAQHIDSNLDGRFPNTFEELLKLKGVGDYTASAIASICFDLPAAVVDGNVYRVLSRVFGIDTPINSTAGIKEFKKLAQHLIDPKEPGTFNQAVMEFGARYCVPQNPKCEGCIFSDKCEAYKSRKVDVLPVKTKKTKVKTHHFNYIVPISEVNKSVLEQRTQKGIWQNLYQFPLVETKMEANKQQLMDETEFQKISEKLKLETPVLYNEEVIIHKLSHKHLHTKFWIAESNLLEEEALDYVDLHRLPVPRLIAKFISEFPPFNN